MATYSNIRGVRDASQTISNTNYLPIDADLIAAMDKEADFQISERKALADQMIEIEQLKLQARDKRFSALSSLVGDISKLQEIEEASRATERDQAPDRILAKQSKAKILQAAENDNAIEGFRFQNFILNADDPTMESLDAGRAFMDTLQVDESVKGILDRYENNVSVLNDVGASVGIFEADSFDEFETKVKQVKTSLYDTLYLNMLRAGLDINNPRLEDQIFKRLHDKVESEINGMRTKFGYGYEQRFEAAQNKLFDEKIVNAIAGANAKDADGDVLDDTFWSKNGVVAQYAARKGVTLPEATEYVVGRLGTMVEDGIIKNTEEALTLMNGIPFYGADGKKYDNFEAWVETLKEGSESERRASALLFNFKVKVAQAQKLKRENTIAVNQAEFDRYVETRAMPLIIENKEKAGIIGLKESQAQAILTEAQGQEWYSKQLTLPKKLEVAIEQATTGGTADKKVLAKQQYSEHLDTAKKRLQKMVARIKNQDGDITKLTDEDDDKVERMYSAYEAEFFGENNENIEAFEQQQAKGEITLANYGIGIRKNIEANHTDYDEPRGNTRLSETKLQAYVNLQTKLSKDGSLFTIAAPLDGEPVDKLLDFVTNPSANQSLVTFYEGLKPRIVTDKGVRVLTGTQAAYYRAKVLGIQDPTTLLPNPESEFLTVNQENNLQDKPNDTKTLISMNENERKNLGKFLDILATGDENTYGRARGGQNFETQGLNRLTGNEVLRLAKRGGTDFGRYKFTGAAIVELLGGTRPIIDMDAPFTEDIQSFLVLARLRQKANKSNAIRGAITKETQDYRRLTNLTDKEIDAVNVVFPNLLKMPMNQFQNLQADVAKAVISDLEKLERQIAGQRQKVKIDRIERERLRKEQLNPRRQVTRGRE